jgi:hypothetical protein
LIQESRALQNDAGTGPCLGRLIPDEPFQTEILPASCRLDGETDVTALFPAIEASPIPMLITTMAFSAAAEGFWLSSLSGGRCELRGAGQVWPRLLVSGTPGLVGGQLK